MKKMYRLIICGVAFFLFLIPISILAQTHKGLSTIIVDAGHGGTEPGARAYYENSMKTLEKDVTLAISLKLVAELKKRLPDVNIVPTRTTDIFQKPRLKAEIANKNRGDLFLCIHADSRELKRGRRHVGSRDVTRYKISYKGKGKKKKTIRTPYTVTEPIYEYYYEPTTQTGTSVWIFAAHKTEDKIKAVEDSEPDININADGNDSSFTILNNTPQMRALAQVYAKRYQEKSSLIAGYVNEEVEKKGRISLGVHQRAKGIAVLQATNMPAILIETGYLNTAADERYLTSERGQQELAEIITNAVIRYKEQLDETKITSK